MNSDEVFFAEALLKWDESFQKGLDINPEDLCGQNTHLLPELKKRINDLKKTEWMNLSSEDDLKLNYEEIKSSAYINQMVFNRYQLKNKIAEGGFAEVWLGFDIELHRNVAIKLPKPKQVEGLDAFIAEARRVARLNHPGIVPVHDIVKENNLVYIISEYVPGGSLKEILAKKKPTSKEAIEWICQISNALDYAHSQGIIHRDIKPANILLNASGEAMIADFGIALSANKTGEFSPSIGTLPYMSPEHLAGKPLDARSDVYSVGILLYELLNGDLPYPKGGLNTLRRNIYEGNINLILESHLFDNNLKRIFAKCLAKDPTSRFNSAGEFARSLKFKKSKIWVFVLLPIILVIVILVFMSFKLGMYNSPKNKDDKFFNQEKILSAEEAVSLGRQKFQKKNYQEAISNFTRAIELDQTCVEAFHKRGAALFNLGKYHDSLPDFTKAIVLSPGNAEILRNRALPFMHLKQYEDAITDLKDAMNFEPSTKKLSEKLLSTVYYAKAYDLEMDQKYLEAIAQSTIAISYIPSALNYQQRGILYFKIKEYEKSISDLTEAVKLAPKVAWHYENRALVYEALGKIKEAKEDNEKAEKIIKNNQKNGN